MKIRVLDKFWEDDHLIIRQVAYWDIPVIRDEIEWPIELSFVQLATPDTTKVARYYIEILP